MSEVIVTSEERIELIIERLLNKIVAPIAEKVSVPSEERLISKREAAKYLSIGTGMIDKLVRQKRLPKQKLGAKALFKQADLDALLVTR